VVIALRKPLALVVIPVVAALAFVLSPPQVKDRIASVADPSNETNRERLLLWAAGLRIVSDYPVFGVGQNSFPLVYPEYRAPDVKEPNISHLHNNFIELAAERGLVGLFVWLWLWGAGLWVMMATWKKLRDDDGDRKAAVCAGAGAVVAFLAAGFFEYNFGDSEIQMLMYFTLAAGTAAACEGGEKGSF